MNLYELYKYVLLEAEGPFKYGCAMVAFNIPKLAKIHSYLDPNDIQELETEFHATLLYGIHEGIPVESVKEIINQYEFEPCIIHNVSLFENTKNDVLKFDVQSTNFSVIHDDLKQLPNSEKFPDYNAHITIAYLKPGTGQKYLSKFKSLKFMVTPSSVVYSEPNGSKTKIEIKTK